MKIGDIIYRKDLPNIRYKIISEDEKWKTCFNVERVGKVAGTLKYGLISKDDERWVAEG